MTTFNITDVIDQAWTLTKKHGILLSLFVLGMFLIFYVFYFFGLDMSAIQQYMQTIQRGGNVQVAVTELQQNLIGSRFVVCLGCAALILCFLRAGFSATLLRLAKGEQASVSLEAFKMPVRKYLNYVGAAIVTGLLLCLASIVPGSSNISLLLFFVLYIAGMWLYIRLMLAPFFVLDRDLGIVEAIKASWVSTAGNFWKIFGTVLLLGLIAFIGLLICCIGYCYTAVIAAFGEVLLYLILSNYYQQKD